jgi:hypothetical protein
MNTGGFLAKNGGNQTTMVTKACSRAGIYAGGSEGNLAAEKTRGRWPACNACSGEGRKDA